MRVIKTLVGLLSGPVLIVGVFGFLLFILPFACWRENEWPWEEFG